MKHNTQSLSQVLPDENRNSAAVIRRVVKIGCGVNILLMILKLTAGYFGNSDALFADGFHSLNDVAADLIMLTFVGISYKAADRRYSYGYGKFETFSSFLISVFLLCIACMICWEAVESIVEYFKGEELPQPDIWTFVVVLFAMATKECLYRFYSRTGRRAGSNALIANAWHHRSDALASVATLIGVTFSHFFGVGFRILDPIASIVIALFIFIPALRLLRPAFAELMEHALPPDIQDKAAKLIASVPGVDGISYLRTRRNGHHYIFDVGLCVNHDLKAGDCGKVAEEVEARLKKEYCPHVIVSVSITPKHQ